MRRTLRWLSMAGAGLIGSALLAATAICLGSGCSSIGYYGQVVQGHLDLMHRARPVNEWLAESATPVTLRERLTLAQKIRNFAITDLGLPNNESYRAYADLKRGAAVWNVVAAPELSMSLKTWCFAVVGCVGYRGYFDQARAKALADQLSAEGYEVSIYGVPAYSTLGWSNWLGGDPLLNTFVNWPEGELARLIFHELAHQVAYAEDDTAFNESFATTVERIGGQRWLTLRASAAARAEFARHEQRREEFRELLRRQRDRLQQLYASTLDDDTKRMRKAEAMALWRGEYQTLKRERWDNWNGYDDYVNKVNNASFGLVAAYNELVPAFERLFEREGGKFERFYAEVRRLAALPREQRRAELESAH